MTEQVAEDPRWRAAFVWHHTPEMAAPIVICVTRPVWALGTGQDPADVPEMAADAPSHHSRAEVAQACSAPGVAARQCPHSSYGNGAAFKPDNANPALMGMEERLMGALVGAAQASSLNSFTAIVKY